MAGDNGIAVADALLSAEPATVAAEEGVNGDKLLQERPALHAGTGDLPRRDVDLSPEVVTVQSQAAAKVGAEVAPVVEEILGEARAAAGRILQAFAALAGIVAATRTGQGDVDRIGQTVAGMMTGGSLINHLNVVDVPADVREMLAGLTGKGPALRPALVSTVGIPSDHNFTMAMGVAAEIMARRQ